MNRISATFLIALLGVHAAIAADEFYLYPERANVDVSCKFPPDKIKTIEAQYSYPDSGEDGVARASAVDLNGDGQCEILLDTPSMDEGNGNAFTQVLIQRNRDFVRAGDIQWTPESWWYGTHHNGYLRIFVPTYAGARTNPHYVTAVYAFDGQQYIAESKATATHGYYLDQGLKAFRSGNFGLAAKYYQNALRMYSKPTLSDASNLALSWIKLGKIEDAKVLIEEHLSKSGERRERAAAYYNLGLIEEKVGSREAALRNYSRANEIEPSKGRQDKLKQLGAIAESRTP